VMGHADIESGAAFAQSIAHESDGRYRAVLKNENRHGLVSLPLKGPAGDSETQPRPRASATAVRAASVERKADPTGATTISKSLKGFGHRTGQTNKGRQTS